MQDDVAVLYLDDEENNLTSFRAAFRRNFRIYTASSATAAIGILRENQVPIVITDQRMPEMTGVQFLEAVVPEFPDTIRMILTGFSDIDAIVRAINAGRVYRYITKPWDERELLMILNNAAQVVRLQRANQSLMADLQQKVTEQERVMKLFQKYVPEDVVREALQSAEGDTILDGETRIISVLISDIRDFTSLSARTDPRLLVRLLNEYFGRMTACVKRHKGSVNKFLGDGLLAIFGAPVSYIGNQENAVFCALDMVDCLEGFNDEFEEQLGCRLRIGIGINTGEVVVGNVGSEDRVEYTVIGDPVNVAARIEALTHGHDDAIFISRGTYDAVSTVIEAEDRGTLPIKGKEAGAHVFRVQGRTRAS